MAATVFNFSFDAKKVLKLVCITWLITKLICYKLWLSDRMFPLVPVHDSFLYLPSWVHAFLFAASLGCMLLVLVKPDRWVFILILLLELFSCILDQNRWQPWEYQFLFFIAVLVFMKDEKQIFFSWQLLIAGIYFFSGLSKLSSDFIHDVWQYLMLHRWIGITHPGTWLIRAGYLMPLIEMAAGLGLLLNATRRMALIILCLMHLLILLLLGPTGLNINVVVWPWNLFMPVLLFILFSEKRRPLYSHGLVHPFLWLVLLCWWILPWLRLAGYWDKYLSSVLYGGGVEQLYICTKNAAARKDMASYLDSAFRVIPCSPTVSVYQWGMKEMRTAPYPEPRVYRAIIREWEKRYPAQEDRFYIFKPGYKYSVNEFTTH